MTSTLTEPKVNLELSQIAAGLVDARPNICYENSHRALAFSQFKNALYVQGFTTGHDCFFDMPMEHCWLELDGEIVEPSIQQYGGTMRYFVAEKFGSEERRMAAELKDPLENAYPFMSLFDDTKYFNSGVFGRLKHGTCMAGKTYRVAWAEAFYSMHKCLPRFDPETIREILIGGRDLDGQRLGYGHEI